MKTKGAKRHIITQEQFLKIPSVTKEEKSLDVNLLVGSFSKNYIETYHEGKKIKIPLGNNKLKNKYYSKTTSKFHGMFDSIERNYIYYNVVLPLMYSLMTEFNLRFYTAYAYTKELLNHGVFLEESNQYVVINSEFFPTHMPMWKRIKDKKDRFSILDIERTGTYSKRVTSLFKKKFFKEEPDIRKVLLEIATLIFCISRPKDIDAEIKEIDREEGVMNLAMYYEQMEQ